MMQSFVWIPDRPFIVGMEHEASRNEGNEGKGRKEGSRPELSSA